MPVATTVLAVVIERPKVAVVLKEQVIGVIIMNFAGETATEWVAMRLMLGAAVGTLRVLHRNFNSAVVATALVTIAVLATATALVVTEALVITVAVDGVIIAEMVVDEVIVAEVVVAAAMVDARLVVAKEVVARVIVAVLVSAILATDAPGRSIVTRVAIVGAIE